MEIFKRVGVENNKGDSFKTKEGIKNLVTNSISYWEDKERPMVAEKIKKYFAAIMK